MGRTPATAARQAAGYEPRFDIDAEYGQHGERYVASIIDGLKHGSVEVKTDARSATTGNIYVEYACQNRQQSWQPSGISTSQADMWAFVLADSVVVTTPTRLLKDVARDQHSRGRKAQCVVSDRPSRGVLIPTTELVVALMKKGVTQ